MTARLTTWSAWLGFLAMLALVLLGGAMTPEYNHVSQFISELGARGAALEYPVRFAGFLPAGVFMCLFAVGAYRILPRSATLSFALLGIFLYAAGYIAAGFFPCDFGCRPEQPSVSQLLHNAFGMVGYLLAPAFLAAVGLAARNWPNGRGLMWLSHGCAVAALLGLMAFSPESGFVGIAQRVIETSVWVCTLALAWRVRAVD